MGILNPCMAVCVFIAPVSAFEASFAVHIDGNRAPISPYIFGTNQVLDAADGYTARRSGGNRLTGYNWENNASNAGSDWNHSSDEYLSSSDVPGQYTVDFHENALSSEAYTILTIQMAGYVSRDKDGTVSEGETAPSGRWVEAVPGKDAPFSLEPDGNDNYVYMDEFVNFMVSRYGNASTATGVKGYSLDNEPALWPSTHPRIHPQAPACAQLVSKSSALAGAVKDVDPSAEIFGPVLYGFAAYTGFQGAPDWDGLSSTYDWFIDYYLDGMRQAEEAAGRRLLDVLDLHWYPEARGDARIVMEGEALTGSDNLSRVQAPLTLWKDGYYENSWIGEWGRDFLPLIPKIMQSIDTYYPGTKLAFTEWCYGGGNHISGGIAAADVLGIFINYDIYLAALWQLESQSDYISSAFKIFRNYDNAGSAYGDTRVPAVMSDTVNSSVYASIRGTNVGTLHLIVINKNLAENMEASFSITSSAAYHSGEVWSFEED
ncbi:glycoside hydrolase family 44 protein, partial [Fibrobacterota bacterium]